MRIVICDDHLLLLEALASALGLHGFTVEAAVSSPPEAVRAVALHDPDLLAIDLSFPEGSGIEAAREVTARHPRTKVVVITAVEETEPLVEALAAGVSGYLRKDQSVDAIARSLERVAQGGTAIDAGLLRQVRHPRPQIPRQRTPMDNLTSREQHVLRLLVAGSNTPDIVRELGVSQSTVRTHVQNIFSKLGVHTRLQAVALLARSTGSPQGGTDHVPGADYAARG